jgi:glutathione S-transferase
LELISEPLFPRYLFIQMDNRDQCTSWSPIRSTLGVSQLAHFAALTAKVDDALVELLRPREQAAQAEAMLHSGDSPVITDGDRTVIESGAIIDYIVRRHGGGRLQPDPASADYDVYQQWLHYSEGSAMLPLMLNLYVSRLGEAGAPLHPRITSEIANHLGYVNRSLAGREFMVGDVFSGADVQMSFVGEIAGVYGLRGSYPELDRWIRALQARPAYRRALERGGPYRFA